MHSDLNNLKEDENIKIRFTYDMLCFYGYLLYNMKSILHPKFLCKNHFTT